MFILITVVTIAMLRLIFPVVLARHKTRSRHVLNSRAGLFVGGNVDSRTFFVRRYRVIPTISFIDELDTGKAFEALNKWEKGAISVLHQTTAYNWQLGRREFTKTVFILNDSLVVELGIGWAEILSAPGDGRRVDALIGVLVACRAETQLTGVSPQVIGFRRHAVLEN